MDRVDGRERAAHDERSRLDDFIDSAVATFWEIDAELRFTFYSDRDAGDGTAGPSSFVLGRTVPELLGPKADQEPWSGHLRDLAARRAFRDFRYSVEVGGSLRHLSSSGRPFFDATGAFSGYRGVTHDVTELEEARRSAAYHAGHDALTGLPNRRSWNEALSRALAVVGAPDGALLLLDLDGFKRINDTLGHAAGDAVLRDAATALRAVTRGSDTIARLGGDEFAVLLGGAVDRAQASIIADRVREAIAGTACEGGLRVHASVGVAMLAEGERTVDALMLRADRAMYEAKATGPGLCAFDGDGGVARSLH